MPVRARTTAAALIVVFALALASAARAQAPVSPDPQSPAGTVSAGDPPQDAAAAGADAGAPWYRHLQVNALVSASSVANLNRPLSGRNQYRVFDARDGGFRLEVAEIDVQRPVTRPGDLGFRTDLTVGSAFSEVTAAYGLFRRADGEVGAFDIHEAFLSYIVPVGRGLRVDAGKFTSQPGYELLEGCEGLNANHSHSFLFGWAQPTTHTGVRLTYPLSEAVGVQALVVNGWDNVRDNNTGKSVGAQLSLTPSPAWSVAVNVLSGPEQAHTNAYRRDLVDLVATAGPRGPFSFAVNYDYGREQHVALPLTAGGGARDATWQGIAGYGRFRPSDRLAVSLRAEWFDDPQGARTGWVQSLTEVTITPEFRPAPHVVVRGDLRRDRSTRPVFELDDGSFGRSQVTISANVLIVF